MKKIPFEVILYITIVVLMSGIIFYLQSKNDTIDSTNRALNSAITDVQFYMEDGTPVHDVTHLSDYGMQGTMYTDVPEIPYSADLCFRSKHTYFTAYTIENDERVILYKPVYPDNKFYTDSFGIGWVVIPLDNSHIGKRIFIDYNLAYDERSAGIDMVMYCNGEAFIVNAVRTRFSQTVMSFTYLILGALLVFLGLIVTRFQKNKTLVYLGLMSIGVACYCLTESQILQLFIKDNRIVHLTSYFALAIVPIPAILFVKNIFGFKYKNTTIIFLSVIFVNFITITILNYLDIMDYHKCAITLQSILIVAAMLMAYSMSKYIVKRIKNKKSLTIYNLSIIIGLFTAIVCGTIDIVRYWKNVSNDPAKFTRVGFLFFIMGFSIASAQQIIEAFKNSTRTELISKLAYEDGLTGLKNRTSYEEMLEYIKKNNISAGIVMMDVNNLKQVNDNLGHDIGDEMLKYASEIIKDAFSKPGMTCYRIGGDEFVAIVSTDNIEEDCETSLERLSTLYNEFNNTTIVPFKIIIAAGFEIYSVQRVDSLEEVVKMADTIMYANKKFLKRQIA